MKKYLLPENGQFYKANLHCHTTISDGKKTPLEVKEMYKSHGYSVIAYTDHDILIPQTRLNDPDFLTLNSFEIQLTEPKSDQKPEANMLKTCHLCFIALDPDNKDQPLWYKTRFTDALPDEYKNELRIDPNMPEFVKEHTPECVNKAIKTCRDAGFFVTYNHPTWSLENYTDYMAYEGMNAMEIVNYSSFNAGYPEYNPRVYDDMLRGGKRIYCLATDDNHNKASDSFGGFVMIKADALEYKKITNALVNGEFYASQGPVINALWIEDGVLHIECESAAEICFETARRHYSKVKAVDGVGVTSGECNVYPEDLYVRVTVTGFDGKHAHTNAYFTDEIL